jgi:glutamate mutase epsilon subunit
MSILKKISVVFLLLLSFAVHADEYQGIYSKYDYEIISLNKEIDEIDRQIKMLTSKLYETGISSLSNSEIQALIVKINMLNFVQSKKEHELSRVTMKALWNSI